MIRYIVVGLVLQCAMVITAHFVEAVLGLSGPLGVGIPLVLGAIYGRSRPQSLREAAAGGLAVGVVGSFVGVVLAILMDDQSWLLLTFAPISSAVAGAMDAGGAFAATRRARSAHPGVAG